jgi:hypothetical protein
VKRTGLLLWSLLLSAGLTGTLLTQVSAASVPGSPKAKLTIGTKSYKFSGGFCETKTSSLFIGIASPPNSLTISGKLHHGKFKNAQIGITLGNGKTIDSVLRDTGTANSKGGKFTGSDISGLKVKGSYTC